MELLRLPETVKGYREVRAPGMAEAYRRAAELQAKLPPRKADASVPSEKQR